MSGPSDPLRPDDLPPDARWAETLTALYGLATKGVLPGLARIEAALSPRARALAVVHVAGTNGKGSVCRMVAAGVRGRVGLFTSPHLHRLTERIRIDGAEIEREALVEAWRRLGPAPALTFFEAITVMGLELFAERGVELAVLETGLGGRLDATNVFDAPAVTAITRVGLDHQRFLGDTLAAIASEKAGILKPGRPAVIGPQAPEADAVLEARALAIGAPLHRAALGPEPRHLPGEHQRENAGVALEVLARLAEQGFRVDPEAALGVRWPGRLEEIRRGGTRWLLDGAHNPDGARALAAHLEARGGAPPLLIFGAMADKDWPAMLDALAPLVGEVVAVSPPVSRGEDAAAIAARVGGRTAESVEEALALAEGVPEVVVAGSLLLLGALRGRLLGEVSDPPIAM